MTLINDSTVPKVGDIVEGRIVKFFDWGALIVLQGGFIGRLRNAHASWSKLKLKANEIFRYGERVTVKVIKAKRSKDHANIYFEFGYRELQPNPWYEIGDKFLVGTCIDGIVFEFLPFGASIRFDNNISGTLHNSELSWTEQNAKASEFFKINDLVNLLITHVDIDKRRIHLSYREAQQNSWSRFVDKFPVGARVDGVIVDFFHFGAKIKMENHIHGLLHNSEISWSEQNAKASEFFKVNDSVGLIIKRIDVDNKKIYLSYREAQPNP